MSVVLKKSGGDESEPKKIMKNLYFPLFSIEFKLTTYPQICVPYSIDLKTLRFVAIIHLIFFYNCSKTFLTRLS